MQLLTKTLIVIGLGSTSLLAFKALEEKGVDINGLNRSIKPTDNFFEFANGTWLKNATIPETDAQWGSFAELRESNNAKLKDLLFGASKANAEIGSNLQKVGDFFLSGMDSVGRNKNGVKGIKPELDLIDGMSSVKDLGRVLGTLHSKQIGGLFYFSVEQDLKNSSEYIPSIYNGGLGMPDRDYYTRIDLEAMTLRKQYTEHIMNIFTQAGGGVKDVTKTVSRIISFETELANYHYTGVERRDIKIQYNRITIDSLKKLCPEFGWDAYFNAIGLKSTQKEIVISNPKFMQQISNLAGIHDLDTWKNYLKWNLLNNCAQYTTDEMYRLDFTFYEGALKGVKKTKVRWKQIAEATDHSLGDALGKLFVDKYFTESAKKKVDEMVDFLFMAYRERIKSRTWMSEATKKAALVKLDAIIRKLGYPEKWKDYSSIVISKDSYVRNYLNANAYEFKRNIDRLGTPIDKKSFGMTAPTINAYYNPSINEIVFPAGIMQYPFFDAEMDMAVNFGAIGGVIGHELTHGFDDQGAQFDEKGNYTMWWTDDDYKKFEEKAQRVVKQFDGYVALDTLRVNGKLTLGENIADLGGLTMAYHALKLYLDKHPEMKKEKKNGFTPEQRLFLGWAKVWCVKYRPESLKNRLITDVHSPGPFRVNGPMSNMPEFYETWGVKEGDGMWRKPEERAEIW